MRSERAALENEPGATQLEVQRPCQVIERCGSVPGPGPDDLIALPVSREIQRQIEGVALHLSGATSSRSGIALAEEREGEVDPFGGDGLPAGTARHFVCPVRQRSRGIGRRP